MNTVPAADRDVQSTDNALVSPELLRITNISLEEQIAAFERLAGTAPARIDTDEECGPWQDAAKEMSALAKLIETTRESTKEPFLAACRIVDGYFKNLSETKGTTPGRLQRAHAQIASPISAYLQRKEAEARKAREEAARRAREDQERADAAARRAAQERQKAEEDGRKRAAANAAARQAQAEADASHAAAKAFEADQQAASKPADLARTRSDSSLATLKVEWDFKVDDLDAIKGAPLWQYVPRAGKEQAIRAYIKANAPKMLAEGQNWQPLIGVTMICKRGLQVR